MAYYSLVRYIGDGSNKTFSVPFQYIKSSDVEVYVDGVLTSFTFLTTSTLQTATPPAVGATVTLKRNTAKDIKLVDYNNGSILDEQALDLQTDQLMYIAQENADIATDSILIGSDGAIDFTGRILRNVGDPVEATDAITLGFVSSALTGATSSATATAEAARDAAIVAKDAAELAEVNAETAEAGAVVAKDAAIVAKDAAVAAASSIPADTLTDSDIGVIVQAYDVDTAKLDLDQSWSGSQRGTVVTDNDGSFDMNAGQNFLCTPAAGFTLTFTNITAGQSGFITLINNSAYTVAKASHVKCGASMLATISATGRYKLNYDSPDGTNVDITASGSLS